MPALLKRIPDSIAGQAQRSCSLIPASEQCALPSANFAPPIPGLADLGLTAVIEQQLGEFQQRTEIACSLSTDASVALLDEAVATALIRILQESLSNVWRHARAKRVDVALYRKDGVLHMSVTDDGIGLASDARRKADSFGLLGMEERAQALGGDFSIHGAGGQGTAVVVSIPLD